MVFLFYPRGYSREDGKDHLLIYMGRDKFENEDLIKWGWPTDVWFHVDDMSSAHVYLRLPDGMTIEDIPPETLEDCAQLVKANSIQGCKTNNVTIVYTAWANLRKTADMDVGQVGFVDQRQVKKVKVDRKNNEILNRLNKTMKEENPDFRAEREAYDAYIRSLQRADQKVKRQAEKASKEEQKRLEDLRSYKTIFTEDSMVSNKQLSEKYKSVQDFEDDFM